MIWDFLLERLIEEQHPEVEHEKCIYKITNGKKCSICRDNCPMEAISLYKKGVSIDERLCENCGICKTMCPTQAISFKGLGELDVHNSIKDKKNIVFGCSKKDVDGNLKLSCLNAIHPEFLAALFIEHIDKVFYFNLSMCEGCSLGDKNYLFNESLNKAELFLKELGMEPKYELNQNEWELRELTDEVYSRRDLFLNLKKNTTNMAHNTLDTILGDNQGIYIRGVLLKALKDKNIDLSKMNSSMFFNTYEVDSNCKLCKKCEVICPEKAWKIEEVDTSSTLYHNSSICVKCELCMDVCPSKAIKISENHFSNQLEFNIKKKVNLKICSDCGEKFIIRDTNDNKCETCIKKEELRKKIRNMDKNI